jgi:hypothetical protein
MQCQLPYWPCPVLADWLTHLVMIVAWTFLHPCWIPGGFCQPQAFLQNTAGAGNIVYRMCVIDKGGQPSNYYLSLTTRAQWWLPTSLARASWHRTVALLQNSVQGVESCFKYLYGGAQLTGRLSGRCPITVYDQSPSVVSSAIRYLWNVRSYHFRNPRYLATVLIPLLKRGLCRMYPVAGDPDGNQGQETGVWCHQVRNTCPSS